MEIYRNSKLKPSSGAGSSQRITADLKSTMDSAKERTFRATPMAVPLLATVHCSNLSALSTVAKPDRQTLLRMAYSPFLLLYLPTTSVSPDNLSFQLLAPLGIASSFVG